MQVSTSRIDEIAGDDKELKKLLVQLFSATFDKCLGRLEKSLTLESEKNKTQEWHDATHELKGSALNLGFNELGERCKVAETYTNDNEKAKFIKILRLISYEISKLVEQI